MHGLRRKMLVTALLAAVATAIAAVPASAGVLVKSAPDCNSDAISNPFTPWADRADYFLAPAARFESAPEGWALAGGTHLVGDNEPWNVSGDGDGALGVPAGGSATTPTICVGLEHPTMRFFARRTSGAPLLASLAVSVQTETSLGLTATVPVGDVLLNDGSWSVTPPMLVVANLLPLLPGELTPIRVRFTAQHGDFRVDDVYVDPSARR
jgi:hypothetical protein